MLLARRGANHTKQAIDHVRPMPVARRTPHTTVRDRRCQYGKSSECEVKTWSNEQTYAPHVSEAIGSW